MNDMKARAKEMMKKIYKHSLELKTKTGKLKTTRLTVPALVAVCLLVLVCFDHCFVLSARSNKKNNKIKNVTLNLTFCKIG